jgi:DNA-formamidopyrimidine glycosylase
MPEGHTIHRIALDHTKLLKGRTLHVTSPQGRFAEGAALLDGRTLRKITPYGKHLWYDVSGPLLHVHLGLYGKFRVGEAPPPEPVGALRIRIQTEQSWLDLRGPTACEVVTAADRDAVLARLGPDPLAPRPDGSKAFARIARSRTTIGALLMDQSVLAGVGNVYRAEVLFRQGISPFRLGNQISEPVWTGVWEDLVILMRAGVKANRIVTTRAADRPDGGSRRRPTRDESFYVYRRAGQPCRLCGTEIRIETMVGRNLFWCPHCQPA